MEATPASTPRTPLTAFEDWHPPPSFVSIGTDTTSLEMVVLPVDAPSSVGDNPPKAALPFEPVQPAQQRLAMQASPQTSDFTSGRSVVHDVPAPPPPAKAVAVGEPKAVPLNPPGTWKPQITGPAPRLRPVHSNWEGYAAWSANQWRPQAWQEWDNQNRNFDSSYPCTGAWRGRRGGEKGGKGSGKGGRSK